MKSLRFFYLALLIAGIIGGCNSGPKAKITSLEKKMTSENFLLDEKGLLTAKELVQEYLNYAENHKDAPDAPDYLYKAADLSLNINEGRQSLELYNRIIYQYPQYQKVPECLFLMGYIHENYFQELGKAKAIYEQFLARYPDHDFADDAQISIENLGKSPEELIRIFEEKNKVLRDTVIG